MIQDLLNLYVYGFSAMIVFAVLFVIVRFWVLLNNEMKRG
jgi:hypothetical protein